MSDPDKTPIQPNGRDFPEKAAPASGTPGKPSMSTGKKVGIGCGGLFVIFMVIGGIGAAADKRRKDAEGAPSPTPASAVTRAPATPAPAAVSSVVQSTGPADVAKLQVQMEEARKRFLSEQEAHGRFQIYGEVKETTDDSLLLWGKAVGGTPNQPGWLINDGNIIITGYDKQNISANTYSGVGYYLGKKKGKGALGQSVPINIYGKEPKSLAAADRDFNSTQAAYLKATEPERKKMDAVIEQLVKDMEATDVFNARISRSTADKSIGSARWVPKDKTVDVDSVSIGWNDAGKTFVQVSGLYDNASSVRHMTKESVTKYIAPAIYSVSPVDRKLSIESIAEMIHSTIKKAYLKAKESSDINEFRISEIPGVIVSGKVRAYMDTSYNIDIQIGQ